MRRTALVVLVLAVAHGTTAAAGPRKGWRLAESLALSPAPSRADVSAVGVSLAVEAEWRSSSGWFLGPAWGATWVRVESPSTGVLTALDPANLELIAGYRLEGARLALGLGVRLCAPLAIFWGSSIADHRATELNHLAAGASRGERGAWLWQTNVAPVGLDAELTVAPTDWLSLALRAEPTALISLNSRPSRFAVRAEVEIAASWRALTARVGGGYLVSTLALENEDHDQLSGWLGVDLAVGDRHVVALDANVNLDGPLGVATGEAKPTWGLVLGARHEL